MRQRLPLLMAAVAAAAVLLPALSVGRIVGIEAPDGYGTQWFYWLTERNLTAGGGWAHTDVFFHPWGKDLLGHTGANFLDALLAAPLRILLGPVAGYNAAALLMLALNGLAFSRLAADLTDDRRAVVLSSILFALNPYSLFELIEGRPTQALLAPLVLFIWMLRRSGMRAAILAGIFLAISGYQYWFYAFFGGMVALGHGLVAAIRKPRILLHHAVVAGVAFALCAPVAIALITASAAGTTPGMLDTDGWSLSGIAPVTVEGMSIGIRGWQPLQGIVGDFTVSPIDGRRQFDPLAPQVSWIALLCALFVAARPGRLQRAPWLAMVLVASVLAIGPVLIVGDRVLVEPLYLGLVKSLAFLQRLWWPARALGVLSVLLSMAVAVVLGMLAERQKLWLWGGLIAALWVGELWAARLAPLPSWDATVPAGYRCLAQGEPGAVLELPYAWSRARLYYQTVHGRPIMGGMLEQQEAFMPAEAARVQRENTFLVGIRVIADLSSPRRLPTRDDRQALHDLGYRYVVLNRDAYFERRPDPMHLQIMDDQLRELLGTPVYEDARIRLYAPWGDPSPCAGTEPVPDTAPIGRTEIGAEWWDRMALPLR